jgi:site-specific DNA-methyltransferase (adenine-specific)
MEINKIINGDCFEVLKDCPDNFFDAIITDPPYGIGIDKWDIKIDIPVFTAEVNRLLNQEFYCFFGQMPTVIDWINEAHKTLKYREQIAWIKRITIPNYNLSRSLENIFIYTKKNLEFYNCKGNYEDIKLPHLEVAGISLHGIDRYIKSLWNRIETGKNQEIGETKTSHIYQRLRFAGNRSPRQANFTNVWSFLPPNNAVKNGIKNKYHPTAKPLELMKRLIELTTPENGIVLDPFAGSFTTAIACLETGRRYVCIEKENNYFEIGKKRIEQWHLDKANEDKKDKQLQIDMIKS